MVVEQNRQVDKEKEGKKEPAETKKCKGADKASKRERCCIWRKKKKKEGQGSSLPYTTSTRRERETQEEEEAETRKTTRRTDGWKDKS